MRGYNLIRIAGLAVLAADPVAAQTPDRAKLVSYGQHLARECAACHRQDGGSSAIPSITGWDEKLFAETVRYYQDGHRTNPAMVSVAQSLDDQQIRALAAYFAAQPKPGKPIAETR